MVVCASWGRCSLRAGMSLMMALQRVTEDTGPVRLVPVEGYVQELGADVLSGELFSTSSAHEWLVVVVRAIMPP